MNTPRRGPTAADEIASLAREIGKPLPKHLKDAIMAKAKGMTQAQVQAAKVKPVVEQKRVRGRQPGQ